MKYKLIALDMDGTLLNSKKEITPLTAQAIARASKAGVVVTVSTGRPIQGVEMYSKDIDMNVPVITYNGAMVVNGKTKEILYKQELERGDAGKILDFALKLGITACIWSGNQLYGTKLDWRIHEYKKLSGVEPQLMESKEKLLDQGITKILWYDGRDKVQNYIKMMDSETFSSVSYCTSNPEFLEFFNRKVSKAIAMGRIGEMLGIQREEMIAVGDAANDLPMLEYAGLGVAMGNAAQDIKERVQYVTASNDDDGIAEVIRKFIGV